MNTRPGSLQDSDYSDGLAIGLKDVTYTNYYSKGKRKRAPMSKNLPQTPKTAAIEENIAVVYA